MKADRWQKIEQVFHAALQRKAEERASFLETTCAGDSALYSDVQALLASNQQDDSFFENAAPALAAEMFTDLVGETIGPYEVLSELGSGAMGIVYLAQDVRLGRKIAIKLLPSQFTNDKDRLRRFQQEARAASALNHPNILTVHEVEQRDGLHYIATEFVDGVTLRQYMNNQRMSLDETLNVATQVASALQAAHAAGIAHRDIKPENVIYIQPLDGSQPTPIPGLESGDEPIQWSDDGRSVYVFGAGEFATKIYRVNLATGNRREWKEIDPPNKVGLVGLELNRGGILITPDGKVCVYTYWILIQQLLTKSLD